MGIIERAKIEGRGIKRWYRKNIVPYNYRFLRRSDGGTSIGPPLKAICPTSAIIHCVNGSDEVFYDIDKIFHLCRNRLTEERLERNLRANAFRLMDMKKRNRITIIIFQPFIK